MKRISKIAVPNKSYKYITDDSRFCDEKTAFLLTSQNRKFDYSKCCQAIELSDIRDIFGIDEVAIIGVTGTNGKTTTSSLIYSILLDLGYRVALQGSRGFYINDRKVEEATHTTPPILDTYRHIYQAVSEGCSYFVMEVSSHAIAQKRIESLNFALKVHTNITQDHLDYHKSMEEYIRVKNSFFSDDSRKLVNRDDEKVEFNYTNSYTYSVESGSTFKVLAYTIKDGVSGIVQFGHEIGEFHSPLYGFFNLYNIVASVSAIKILTNRNLQEICQQVENFYGVAGRMEVVSEDPLVIIDFAHTPDGMEKVLSSFQDRNLIVVFGAGGDRDISKRPMMGAIAKKHAKHVIITSDNPRFEEPEKIVQDILAGIEEMENVEVILNRREAIKRGLELQNRDDILLILGKGDEEYQIIYDKKLPFSDREVVKEILEAN